MICGRWLREGTISECVIFLLLKLTVLLVSSLVLLFIVQRLDNKDHSYSLIYAALRGDHFAGFWCYDTPSLVDRLKKVRLDVSSPRHFHDVGFPKLVHIVLKSLAN